MSVKEFQRYNFTASLPPLIRIPVRLMVPGGAIADGYDINRVQLEDAFLMIQKVYTTEKRIHGVLHHEGVNQTFFIGYECNVCHEIFLVPDTVVDLCSLGEAMRHGCAEPNGR
jgi:hypothetical protein